METFKNKIKNKIKEIKEKANKSLTLKDIIASDDVQKGGVYLLTNFPQIKGVCKLETTYYMFNFIFNSSGVKFTAFEINEDSTFNDTPNTVFEDFLFFSTDTLDTQEWQYLLRYMVYKLGKYNNEKDTLKENFKQKEK